MISPSQLDNPHLLEEDQATIWSDLKRRNVDRIEQVRRNAALPVSLSMSWNGDLLHTWQRIW